jgi:flavin-dependent dehydrogenase
VALTDCDILIVGGGPAGISTWLHLHALAPRLAAQALLIEKATHPRDKPCGGGVALGGDRLLAELGVAIRTPCVFVHNLEFRFGEETLSLRRPNAIRVIRRRDFDHGLARAAVERGLELREGEAFRGFDRAGGHLLVKTSRGSYRVRVLVGADGAQSRVRRRMGAPRGPQLARAIAVLAPVQPEHDREFETHTAVFDFGPAARGLQGYAWHFPSISDGGAVMNHGVYDSRVHRVRTDLKDVLLRELRARGVSPDPRTFAAHPLRRFSPEGVFAAPNLLLVGDAAGADGALGEGIAQALAYGGVAAHALIDGFRRRDFSMESYATAFRSHPLGGSLRLRARMAQAMYAGGPAALAALREQVAAWLSVGAP